MFSNDNTCGTDQTGLLSCRFQHSLYHMGRGSLSLGACNADQGKLLCRISKTGRRQQGQSPAGILYPQDRNLFLLLFIKLTASSSISMGRSVTRILVPAFNTSGIKQWASIRVPVMATNTVPDPAFLES